VYSPRDAHACHHLVAASLNFLGGGLAVADVAPAQRARGVQAQPQVDAADVEQVAARRQQPDGLPVAHDGEADGALRPPGAPPVREHRERGERGRLQPAPPDAAAGHRAAGASPSHSHGRVAVGEGAPEADGHREDDEARRAGQADEHHRVAHLVAAADGVGVCVRGRHGAAGTVEGGRHGPRLVTSLAACWLVRRHGLGARGIFSF
jgi:hypothetical protein